MSDIKDLKERVNKFIEDIESVPKPVRKFPFNRAPMGTFELDFLSISHALRNEIATALPNVEGLPNSFQGLKTDPIWCDQMYTFAKQLKQVLDKVK